MDRLRTKRPEIKLVFMGVNHPDMVFGPKSGVHSGNYGNWVPNPAQRLALPERSAAWREAAERIRAGILERRSVAEECHRPRRRFEGGEPLGAESVPVGRPAGLAIEDERRCLEVASTVTQHRTFLGAHVVPDGATGWHEIEVTGDVPRHGDAGGGGPGRRRGAAGRR